MEEVCCERTIFSHEYVVVVCDESLSVISWGIRPGGRGGEKCTFETDILLNVDDVHSTHTVWHDGVAIIKI